MKTSVVMAAYNGGKYIKEQIDSILKNLDINDELIISDDGSTDETLNIINIIASKDSRVRVIKGPHKGIKDNFENAIKVSTGDYIFISDQDDIWMENKTSIIKKEFENNLNINVIVHDNIVVDSDMNVVYNSLFEYRKSGKGILKNIYKNTYIGCCMAMRGTFKDKILPFPKNIHMHDQWIGIISDLYKSTLFINDKLIYYRRHGKNNSSFKNYPFLTMLKHRMVFIFNLLKYCFRKYKKQ